MQDWLDILVETVVDLGRSLAAQIPLIVLALLVFAVGWLVVGRVLRGVGSLLDRSSVDPNLAVLIDRVTRVLFITLLALLSLSVAGVDVGAALATLGIAGLALAFALQNILENFVSGVLILLRKPFQIGDQVITNDFEGTVEDVDLRVTRLVTYDGETVSIPNKDVFSSPLVNLTRRGIRRSRVQVGIDYRDDQDAARDVILAAVTAAEGVADQPPPQAVLVGLGPSSVDYEIRYWTAPDIGSVVEARHQVITGVKRALEEAGMSIPWPIRTIAFDRDVSVPPTPLPPRE
ncbi:MAG: transporter [Acidimicrobiia bacterium]|nr:MAG: transporter [Acidimicrobiia bacterium]